MNFWVVIFRKFETEKLKTEPGSFNYVTILIPGSYVTVSVFYSICF